MHADLLKPVVGQEQQDAEVHQEAPSQNEDSGDMQQDTLFAIGSDIKDQYLPKSGRIYLKSVDQKLTN